MPRASAAAPTEDAAAGAVAQWPFLLLLAVSALVCGLFLYWWTLSASYAYDDVDHLNAAADVLAGRQGYWAFVFRPHLEVVPGSADRRELTVRVFAAGFER